jgi:predicted pyridoxine 5'-phosphate oxidase superfamily flavin-nucleotide-binding protein
MPYRSGVGRTFDRLTDDLRDFLGRQHVFFVATAPLAGDGHVNVSPKGYDTFRVLDDRTVCYLDITGSGAETIAHVRENGRITIMCCAFEGSPDVVRLYGRGEVVLPADERFAELAERFPSRSGVRAVIVAHLDRISSTCGFGVPLMDFVADRGRLEEAMAARGEDGVAAYIASKNAVSIDGLPAVDGG